MQDIEQNFIEKNQNFSILPRRFGIKSNHIHLFGPPKSGKTSLALDFAGHFKKPIYIDCQDPRMDIETTKNILLKLYLEKKIDILIIDNFSDTLSLPNLQNIILITQSQNAKIPKNFISKKIYPLSFEEYISFDKKNLSINTLLNHFLKDGNLPEIQYLQEYQKIPRKQEIITLSFKQNTLFFQNLLRYQGYKITPNQIYTQLKKYIKISKDKIYEYLQSFQENQTIYLISDINNQSKLKKIYFYDFSLPYAFVPERSFQSIFENMLILELIYKYDTIYYDKDCDFITQNLHAYIAIPFPTEETIKNKINKIEKKFSQITIITISYESEGKTPYTQWRAMTFTNFALNEF